MKNTTFSKVHGVFSWLIAHRVMVIGLVLALTAAMGYMASKVEVKTIFSDLLPKSHPYVKVNQKFKSTFGGSNLVTIMVENQKGDIFDLKVLERFKNLPLACSRSMALTLTRSSRSLPRRSRKSGRPRKALSPSPSCGLTCLRVRSKWRS